MTPPLLWLVHGWGFGPGFWRPLMAVLPDWPVLRADLGFFGPAAPLRPPEQPFVAVGHSLGFMRALLALGGGDAPCLGLVAINGFSRFCAGADFPRGVPPRLVQHMMDRLASSPEQVLAEFCQRAGGGRQAGGGERGNGPALHQGLNQLLTLDGRAALAAWRAPLLVLAADDDLIVPPALTRGCFPPPRQIQWSAQGGHVLPLSQASWCAAWLRGWVEHHVC